MIKTKSGTCFDNKVAKEYVLWSFIPDKYVTKYSLRILLFCFNLYKYLLSRYQMFKQYISLASILRPRNSLIATSKLYVVDKARLKKVASL